MSAITKENARLRQRVAELTVEVDRVRATATAALQAKNDEIDRLRRPKRVLDKNATDAFSRPARP